MIRTVAAIASIPLTQLNDFCFFENLANLDISTSLIKYNDLFIV
jgi:hypothetical protein